MLNSWQVFVLVWGALFALVTMAMGVYVSIVDARDEGIRIGITLMKEAYHNRQLERRRAIRLRQQVKAKYPLKLTLVKGGRGA